jgi:ketosteroid isomerase-like protein
MRTRRLKWLAPVSSAVLVAAGAMSLSAQPQPATSEREVQAIQRVLERMVSTINGPAFARAPRDRRVEMLKPFYRADNTFARDQQPVFFGPLSEPLARGVNAHLENMALNFEWVFKQGMVYGLRIDEMQIEVDRQLAVVLALTTSGFGTADNKTTYATRGRATIIMNKMANGQWLISHEHNELYNPENPNAMTKEKLEAEIRKIKPR